MITIMMMMVVMIEGDRVGLLLIIGSRATRPRRPLPRRSGTGSPANPLAVF